MRLQILYTSETKPTETEKEMNLLIFMCRLLEQVLQQKYKLHFIIIDGWQD